MKTIALETSSTPGSLALLDDEDVVYERQLPERERTTATFAVELQAALRQFGWRPAEVDLFAVCEGPGSFTGLRIGVTAAKTFAYAIGCQLVALNTLEVVASQAAQELQPLWAVLDAQRQQLFVAQYELRAGTLHELTLTDLVKASDWLASLPAGTIVTGTGLRNWTAQLSDRLAATPRSLWDVVARSLGKMAVRRHAEGKTNDLWQLVPRYYRPSAAEEKRRST
jgi:tRNA threonylcarbamoyladenosine biosynthesis protein TsaB